ncbi:MAG: DUF86 domain-containing protein [Crenarchaeota archaeon]|nr:DUF86 domain-containing protein [Thermoproteota archaeon]
MPTPGLEARLARARRSLSRLRRIAETPWERYAADEDLQALAERHLHIVLEAILDLAAFIAARRGAARGPTYRDVVEAVIALGVVPTELRPLARAVPGMRNILVHGYADIRHDLLYEALRGDLEGLERLLLTLAEEAERLDP